MMDLKSLENEKSVNDNWESLSIRVKFRLKS